MTATTDTTGTLTGAELVAAHRAAWEVRDAARTVLATVDEASPEWERAQHVAAEACVAEKRLRNAVLAAGLRPDVDVPLMFPASAQSTRERFDDVDADVMHAARRSGRVR